jgi:hypothetical protein
MYPLPLAFIIKFSTMLCQNIDHILLIWVASSRSVRECPGKQLGRARKAMVYIFPNAMPVSIYYVNGSSFVPVYKSLRGLGTPAH